MSSGPAIQTRIITSIAAIAQSPAQPVATTSTAVVTTTTVSMATVATGTTIHLTQHQQTLLARVEGQMKALASNTSRTPEQEKFLLLLMNAQQQIHAQGRCQLQAALTGGGGKTSSTSLSSVSTMTTANPVSVTATPAKTTASKYSSSLMVSFEKFVSYWEAGCDIRPYKVCLHIYFLQNSLLYSFRPNLVCSGLFK